jgi:amino acid transporter
VIALLSLVNLRGLRSGAATQNWLTLAEVGGLLLIAGAAALFADAGPAPPPPSAAAPGSFGMAMVFVLLTYGGWNEAAYISAEVRDGPRNMVRALTLSVLVITVLYLLVTWACWKTLGWPAWRPPRPWPRTSCARPLAAAAKPRSRCWSPSRRSPRSTRR